MSKRISILGISCIALVVGCSAPATSEDVGSNQAALSHDDDEGAIVVRLSSYDPTTGMVTGRTHGVVVSVQLATTSLVKRAVIPAWPPTPVRELAISWNELIETGAHPATFGSLSGDVSSGGTSDTSYASLLGQLAAGGADVRVHVESGAVTTIRPLP